VNAIDIGPFFTIDFDVHKLAIHDRGRLFVLERLVCHHVAPVTGRITDREKDRFVLATGFGKCFFAPRIPIDRIMRVLKKIRRLLARESVRVRRVSRLNFRGHDLVWTCRDRHSTDGAGPEHSRGNNRFISVLAGRSFLLEIILAIRAALGSGRISRRLYPTLGFNSKNLNRTGAAFLSCAIDLSPWRSRRNSRSIETNGRRRWRRPRISVRPNRDWWRNFSHAAPFILPVGTYSSGGGDVGRLHFGEFNRRTGRIFHGSSLPTGARTLSSHPSYHWWNDRITFRQPTFSRPRDFNSS